ncbi:MAG: hypothetical protein AB7G88_09955, partial [Thermomicrobiales bacterium]
MGNRFRKVMFAALIAVIFGVVSFGAPQVSAQESVYSDDMSNPAFGLFSQSSPDPSQYSYQYKNGQF